MSTATYGDCQEAAAAALNRLIATDELPIEPADIDQVLHCRDIVIDAVRQRLYTLGVNAHFPAAAVPAKIKKQPLTKAHSSLATLVNRIAFEVPTLPMDERRPATDVLGRTNTSQTVQLWQQTALELLAGSHALDAAAEHPWLHEQGGGWYLMRDVAVTVEALLVLDSRLEEVGLLSSHHRPETTLGLEERRMVASQCARVATWHATSDSPDQATPEMSTDRVVTGPVHTIRTPADLAVAQRRLASYLRPMHGGNAFYNGEPEMDSTTARMVVASQAFLTRAFESITRQVPGSEHLSVEFAARRESLQDIQTSMAYLVDDQDHGRNIRAAWQQGELTTAVRRMQRDGTVTQISPSQLHDLANATHETTHNTAKALRRELLRDSSNLRMEDPTKQVGRTRVHRYHPLERTLTDMVNLPSPSIPVAKYSSPLQRAALRATLDVTPTSQRAPSPYPPARAVGTSDLAF